jgi:hypothetical protein
MSKEEIKSIVDRLADVAGVLRDANPKTRQKSSVSLASS